MTRMETLKAAAECVCGSREEDYGSPEDNFSTIAALWTAYTGTDIAPKDVAMMMALLKIARAKAGSKPDTYVDLAGYAACGAEISVRDSTVSEKAAGTEVKLRRMDGYYLVEVDGREAHRFTLWENAMAFIRDQTSSKT